MSNPLSFYANPIPAKGYSNFSASGTAVWECSPPKNPQQPPTTVSVVLSWSDYTNIIGSATPIAPVSINLQGGVRGAPIDSLRSIKIDNLASALPVTVFFPDTGDEIVCAAFSTTRSNVLTGGYECVVYMPLDTKNIGKQTTIFFNNFNVDPADIQDTTVVENQEWATGAPFSLNNLGPRARVDRWQRVTMNLALTGAASRVALFGGPVNGFNFVVLSEIHFRPIGCYSSGISPVFMSVSLLDDNVLTQASWEWYARNDIEEYSGSREIVSMVNLQVPLVSYAGPTTFRHWFLQNAFALPGGSAECDLGYTLVNVTNF
jgi:hypothetical protein